MSCRAASIWGVSKICSIFIPMTAPNRPRWAAWSPNGWATYRKWEKKPSATGSTSRFWQRIICASIRCGLRRRSMETPEHRAGFVAILGRPNAGKSTLLNALLGTKLAIVASKPQTTRTAIQGDLTLPEAQIAYVDTPGIHKSSTLLNKRMMDAVRTAADAPDLVVFVIDALAPFSEQDAHAVDLVIKAGAPA